MSLRRVTILWALLLGMGCSPEAGSRSSPVDCIRDMSRYSKEGRVEEYLACFDSGLRARLEKVRGDMKPGEFVEALRRRAEPIRGIAFSDETPLDEKTVRVKVEWVFTDRNEVQLFQLKKVDGSWKIADMTEAQYKKPPIPYGTKVFD